MASGWGCGLFGVALVGTLEPARYIAMCVQMSAFALESTTCTTPPPFLSCPQLKTGGSSGVAKEVIKDLTSRGATVYAGCR
jgi:hypothetical protein